MSIVKTTEEFSTRRKIRYGAGTDRRSNSPLKKPTYTISSASTSASLSPHKHFYGEDQDGHAAYFIEFNIGDFQFDEITIRTEGKRLIVQGKSKLGDRTDPEELSREFKRDFTLPPNVDPYSIKAQLDESTRMLTLIGQVVKEQAASQQTTTTTASSSSHLSNGSGSPPKVGSIKENRSQNSIEYEVYLGPELRDGQVNVELSSYNNLLVKINGGKSWDTYGEYELVLNRQIKLPSNGDAHQISHGIDARRSCLLIKLPLKSIF